MLLDVCRMDVCRMATAQTMSSKKQDSHYTAVVHRASNGPGQVQVQARGETAKKKQVFLRPCPPYLLFWRYDENPSRLKTQDPTLKKLNTQDEAAAESFPAASPACTGTVPYGTARGRQGRKKTKYTRGRTSIGESEDGSTTHASTQKHIQQPCSSLS